MLTSILIEITEQLVKKNISIFMTNWYNQFIRRFWMNDFIIYISKAIRMG